MRKIFLFLILTGSLTGVWISGLRAEFVGAFPTGLLLLEKKYPYYLFVPETYSTGKTWPLVLVVGDRGTEAKEVITPWVDWAKKNEMLVLAVPNLFPQKDLPEVADQWLFEVKREIGERYRINPYQVLLVGSGTGAHYAAYIGIRYPKEFSAVALVEDAWPGPFEKLMKPALNRRRQIPFYVAMDSQNERFPAVEAKALELEKRGYRITMDSKEPEKDFAGFQDRMIKWFLEDSEYRTEQARISPQTRRKSKWQEIRKNLFEL